MREKPYPDEDRVKGDPARDLATVHHVCETHLSELVDISRELNSVKVNILDLKKCQFKARLCKKINNN